MLSFAEDLGIHGFLDIFGTHGKTYFTAARQLSVGPVIPDLMIAGWSEIPAWSKRPISGIESATLAYVLNHHSVSRYRLQADLFMTDSGVQRVLNSIAAEGLLTFLTDTDVQAKFPNSEVHVTAIEFKLKKWRDALQQATKYLEFANEAYVILDAGQVVCGEEMRALFSSAGVGLVLQSPQGFEVSLRGTIRDPISASRIQALSKLAQLVGFKTAVSEPCFECI